MTESHGASLVGVERAILCLPCSLAALIDVLLTPEASRQSWASTLISTPTVVSGDGTSSDSSHGLVYLGVARLAALAPFDQMAGELEA
jgi:hypothetical protein